MGGNKYKQSSTRHRSSKKRKFAGNRFTIHEDDDPTSATTTTTSTEKTAETEGNTSASASKINLSFYKNLKEDENNKDTSNMYMFMDIQILLDLIQLVGVCPKCQDELVVFMDSSGKKGLVQKLILQCNNGECSWCHSLFTSTKVRTNSNRFDLNVRSIIAFREVGRGLTNIETFCRVMNMPPPYTHKSYDDVVKEITPRYISAMEQSMSAAAGKVSTETVMPSPDDYVGDVPPPDPTADDSVGDVRLSEPTDDNGAPDVSFEREELRKCDVSLDGSWQRRGYASLNGFVSCIERCHDKVIDVDVMTKDCRACKYWKGKEEDPGYNDWVSSHNCPINHTGSSGSMKTEGAVRVFNRYIEKNQLMYANYIGDGDSSAYKNVCESRPYGDIPIGKLECVGHIQKRVAAGLLTLVKEHKGIGGRGEGKLTRKVINTLQNYYGMAIRNNKNKILPEMKIAIVAVLHHCTQKDGVDIDERHQYCPRNDSSWCKYQKCKVTGEEFKGDRINIAEPIYQLIRPLWLRLSDNELLEKCLHGRTQNFNEAFNAFVWKRAPKDVFVGKSVLDIAVAYAVVAFNDGAAGIINIMDKIGLYAGHFNIAASQSADLIRIVAGNYKSSEKAMIRRKKLHAQKKGYTNTSDKDYGAGMH